MPHTAAPQLKESREMAGNQFRPTLLRLVLLAVIAGYGTYAAADQELKPAGISRQNRATGKEAAKRNEGPAGGVDQGEGSPDEKARPRRQGKWIRVHLPIENGGVSVIKQEIARTMGTVHDERPVFVLEFTAPEGSTDAGRGTKLGAAAELADFLTSDEVNAANTIAYIPKALKGHAVLAAIACEQIIMSPTAVMEDAGCDEKTIRESMLKKYEEIARSRRSVPVEIALGLLDKSRRVMKVMTVDGMQFVAPSQVEELTKTHRLLSPPQVIKSEGVPWQFTGVEAREWGVAGFLADDRRDVIRQVQLSPGMEEGDPSGGGAWRPIRVDLKGTIHPGQIEALERLIDEECRKGANFICVWIDSNGGAPRESKSFADYLIGLPREKVRIVAYIPTEALADAALVAMACDQIVMHPQAKLGGAGMYQMDPDAIGRMRSMIRDSLAPAKSRSWSLWAAMFDRNLTVYRCQRMGDVEYFCDEELDSRQPKRGEKGAEWQKGEAVPKEAGRVLLLTGEKAQEYGLVTRVVNNFTEFKQNYGLENDPTLVEPGWVDHLARFLSQPAMFGFLIFLGGLGIYIELHAPGLGIGAFLSVVAFALFFWSQFLQGTATWLEVTLFVTGCVCLITEIFLLPGFVVFGLGGGVLIITSIVLASQTFFIPQNEYQVARLQTSLLTMTFSIGGLIGAIWFLNHWLPRAPVLSHVFLAPPEGEEAEIISRREMLVDLDNLVGAVGVATTPLGPAGKARFANHLVDVISTGEFIARDSQVVVMEVHGNRVVVRLASGGTTA
jgi:membrane-bound serine protease (ClpP class)